MSSPSKIILPESGFSKPAIILRSVDFPQPDEPNKLKSSDFEMLKLTLSKAITSPNFLEIFLISRNFVDISLVQEKSTTE